MVVQTMVPEGYDVASKKTVYNGVEFRSKLEAQWAAFFDQMQIQWEYEKHKLPIKIKGRKTYYVPDFYLPEHELFVEVKGTKKRWYMDMAKTVLSHARVMIAPPVFDQFERCKGVPAFTLLFPHINDTGSVDGTNYAECFFGLMEGKPALYCSDIDEEMYPAPQERSARLFPVTKKMLSMEKPWDPNELMGSWYKIASITFDPLFLDPDDLMVAIDDYRVRMAYEIAASKRFETV